MEERVKKLKQDGEKLFSDRQSLESLWQDIAENFFVEMAEFTLKRDIGDEWADHLTTSYPILARRSLGDALSALLRPVSLDTTSPGVWFSVRTEDERADDLEGDRWLEWATGVQRRAMYDRAANFVRATKQGDHMFATFGQTPLMIDLNRNRDALMYRCVHLKDVVWSENSEGHIDTIYRKWSPTATQLVDMFGGKVAPRVKTNLDKDPYQKVNCMHVVLSSEKYEQRDIQGRRYRKPWISIWIDVDNDHVMEEIERDSRVYVIPRWVTVPGSQYASSPAVTAALPDARLIQAMTLTLLEAGEKYADPPIIATTEAIRSDVNLFAGGITYVDAAYDERLGDSLRPLYEPRAGEGMRMGLELRSDIRDMIAKAFFLDSLSLPPAGVKEMTAFEVGQRISEWIRRAMPIFEPMEFEYNAPICEETFEILLRNGAFGSYESMPQSLKGKNLRFKFESPLHESMDRKKGQKFLEAKAALVEAADLDPSVLSMLNARTTLRDVLKGIGVPSDWPRDDREMEILAKKKMQEQQAMAAMEQAAVVGEAAKNLGSATKDFAQASGTPQAF